MAIMTNVPMQHINGVSRLIVMSTLRYGRHIMRASLERVGDAP